MDQDFSPAVTVGVVVVFLAIGLLPKIPVWAKILVQILGGVILYKVFGQANFNLPNGDNMEVSSLYGGSGPVPDFNKLSMGVICPILGIIVSLIFGGIAALLGRKKAEE